MKKLKEKWGIESDFQLIIILIVFSITGSLSLYISKPILDFIGLDKEALSGWVYTTLRLLLIFPFYQVLILIVGTLFGQFKFFWKFERKMLSYLGFKQFKD